MSIEFKVEKMFRLPGAGSLKAFCDVSINDAIVIRGIRIVEGKKGIFVSMPMEQGKDSKWYEQVTCKTSEVYDSFSDVVIKHYKEVA